MNSCDYYQELISRLVDGELSRDERAALMEHMKSCSACNAMYAVFHDLSEILSEEEAPLPEGLHENIMAGVRRSEMARRNRRMRTIGLRTALTAAACMVLVLFAATGFDPGKRAESVSIRSQEAAEQLLPAPTEAAQFVESTPVPTQTPVQTPAPVQTPTPAPAQTPTVAPAPTDAYLATGGETNTQYSAPQQEQSFSYNAVTPAPTVAPVIIQSATAPTVAQATPAPVPTQTPVWTEAPAAARSADVTIPETAVAEPAAEPVEEADEGFNLFTLFSGMSASFDAAPEALEEAKAAAPEELPELVLDLSLSEISAFDAGPDAEEQEPNVEDIPEVAAAPEEPAPTADRTVSTQDMRLYGKALQTQLLALLGEREDPLPEEAELTRLGRVTLVPDDSYGSEEQLELRIYGDFVFYQRRLATGESSSFRADCSLKELDSFLDYCETANPVPSAAPTVDPFSMETSEP